MLRERVQKFIDEFDMPITIFCRKIELTPDSYYKWKKGQLNFSEKTIKRISDYLSQYGF